MNGFDGKVPDAPAMGMVNDFQNHPRKVGSIRYRADGRILEVIDLDIDSFLEIEAEA